MWNGRLLVLENEYAEWRRGEVLDDSGGSGDLEQPGRRAESYNSPRRVGGGGARLVSTAAAAGVRIISHDAEFDTPQRLKDA